MMWHVLFHLAWEIAFQGRNGKMVQGPGLALHRNALN